MKFVSAFLAFHSVQHSYVQYVCCVRTSVVCVYAYEESLASVTFSTFRVLTVQSGRTSSDTFEMRMSLNTDIGLLSSGQYL